MLTRLRGSATLMSSMIQMENFYFIHCNIMCIISAALKYIQILEISTCRSMHLKHSENNKQPLFVMRFGVI